MAATDYGKFKEATVSSLAGSPSLSNFPVYIKAVDGDDSTTGTGDCVIDAANIDGPEDIAVYDEQDNLLDYYVENTVTGSTTTFHIWVRPTSLNRDGTAQIRLYYGSGASDESVSEATLWDSVPDLQLRYSFEGGDALDSTSNNNDGTVNGSTTTGGAFGEDALSFDGTDDNVNIGQTDFTPHITVIGFLKNSGASGNLWDNGNDRSGNFWFPLNGDGSIGFGIWPGGGWWGGTVSTATGFDGASWKQWAFTWDGTTGRAYSDGGEDNTKTDSGNLSTDGADGFIGEDIDGGSNGAFDLDEVWVFNADKGDDWVETNWDMSSPGGQTLLSWNGSQQVGAVTRSISESLTLSDVTSTVADYFRTKSDTLVLNDTVVAAKAVVLSEAVNLGDEVASGGQTGINGTVTLDSNPVTGAIVFAYDKTADSFVGKTTTDGSGNYSFSNVDVNNTVLVAVDYDDGGTLYGDEMSISVDFE